MKKILSLSGAVLLSVALCGCQSTTETGTQNSNAPVNAARTSQSPTAATKPEQTIPIDAAKLADRSSAALDEIFGAPLESRPLENGGEYRLYRIAGQPKGLAVRFFGGRAKSFNLILDEPVPSAKEALKRIFNIDAGNFAPVKDPKEPLTESYRGTSGGVKFKKVSAKREANGKGFIFVLAEVAE